MKKTSNSKKGTMPAGAPKGMNPLAYFNSLKGKPKTEPKPQPVQQPKADINDVSLDDLVSDWSQGEIMRGYSQIVMEANQAAEKNIGVELGALCISIKGIFNSFTIFFTKMQSVLS